MSILDKHTLVFDGEKWMTKEQYKQERDPWFIEPLSFIPSNSFFVGIPCSEGPRIDPPEIERLKS